MPDQLDKIIDIAAGRMQEMRSEIIDPDALRQAVFDALDKKKKKRRFFFWLIFSGILISGTITLAMHFTDSSRSVITARNSSEKLPGKRSLKKEEKNIQTENPVKNITEDSVRKNNSSMDLPEPGGKETSVPTGLDSGYREPPGYPVKENGKTLFIETKEAWPERNPIPIYDIKQFPIALNSTVPVPDTLFPPGFLMFSPKEKEDPTVKLSIGIFSSLLFDLYDISPVAVDSNGVSKEKYKKKIRAENNWNRSFDAGIAFTVQKKQWKFEANFAYTHHSYHQINDSNFNFTFSPSPSADEVISYIHQYEMGFLAGYRCSFGKFSLTPMAGISAGWMQRRGYYALLEGSNNLLFQDKARHYFLLNADVHLDLRYQIVPSFSVALTPVFRYNPLGFSEKLNSFRIRPVSLGLRGGVHYHF